MKHYLRAALWLLLAYHGIFFLVPVILGSLPILLVLERGASYDWTALLAFLIVNAALFATTFLCYRHIFHRHQALKASLAGSCLLLLAVAAAIRVMYPSILWPLDIVSIVLLAGVILNSRRLSAPIS